MKKQKKSILDVRITRTPTGTKFFFRSDVFEKFFADAHAKDFDKDDLIENALMPFCDAKLYRALVTRIYYSKDISTLFASWMEKFPFETYDPIKVNLIVLRAVGLAQGVTLEVPGLFMTDYEVEQYLECVRSAAQKIYEQNIRQKEGTELHMFVRDTGKRRKKELLFVRVRRIDDDVEFFFRSRVIERFFADLHGDSEDFVVVTSQDSPWCHLPGYRVSNTQIITPHNSTFVQWGGPFKYVDFSTVLNLSILRAVGLAQGITIKLPEYTTPIDYIVDYLYKIKLAVCDFYAENIARGDFEIEVMMKHIIEEKGARK